MATGGSSKGRGNFNPAGRYNPGHERGRSYGGYVRGWQRRPYRGYRYSGSRFNGSVGRGGGDQGIGQTDHHVNGTRAPVHHLASAGVVPSHRGASDPHVQEVFRAQKAGKAEAGEPQVPEVFKNEKAGKAKVDEGQSSEGDDKPFCFRCYKPGHGKLVCSCGVIFVVAMNI
jgi:hypothetical protein